MAVTRATAAADLRNVMSKRVVALFRAAARDAPLFVKVYSLEQTPAQVGRCNHRRRALPNDAVHAGAPHYHGQIP
jgi:hypothetical protein